MFVKVVRDNKGLGLSGIYQDSVLIGIMRLLNIEVVEAVEVIPTKYRSYCKVYDKAITEVSCVECPYWLNNEHKHDICANRDFEYKTGERFYLHKEGKKEYEEEKK